MKKLALAGLIALGLGTSQVAVATNAGTVTITGEVIQTTCQIKSGDENKTVTLPKVPTTALSSAGDTAGTTPFTLTITKCSAGDSVEQAGISWDVNSTNVNTNTGNLTNIATGGTPAENVEVQLLEADGSAITIGGTNDIDYTALKKTAETDETVFKFFAQYHATAQSTAGEVKAIAPFSVVYK